MLNQYPATCACCGKRISELAGQVDPSSRTVVHLKCLGQKKTR